MLSPRDKDKINDFLRKGKKIEAVKYLRDYHQLSLKEASDWVAFISGDAPVPPAAAQENISFNIQGDQKVKWLLQHDKYLEAINHVRTEKKLSLKAAKEYVDRFSAETGIRIPASTRWNWNSSSMGMFIFLLVGSIFLITSLSLAWRDYEFYRNSTKANGKVISLQYATGTDPESGAVPIVEYTWRGQKQQVAGDTYSNPPAVEIGEHIEVLISQQDSRQVKLNIISERYFLIFIFGILGTVFFAIGFVGKYGLPKW